MRAKMKKREFQEKICALLSTPVEGVSWDEKLSLIKNESIKIEKEKNDCPDNKGQPWTDSELRLVLNMPANTESVCLLAKALKRGHGSIEQIYRWAGQSPKRIATERSNDKFIQQIARIRKEIGWRSVGGNS